MAKNNLKKLLEAYLSIEKIKLVPSSFDVVGSIAIVEFPEKLKKDKKIIAKAMLDVHKNIKTVLEKVSERKGKLRLRQHKFLAGQKNSETLHKEYGCVFKVDPTKVYFSPRELTERQRIAEQVKPKESILVPFSGISPFPIVIAKKQSLVKEIYAIELNPTAHKYALENIRLNKVSNKINLIQGDVKKVCPRLKKKFNRIIMPLPKGGYEFLNFIMPCLKNNGIVHFYYWASEDNLFTDARKIIKRTALKFNKKFRILNKKKVLPFGPRKWKIVLDVSFFK